VFFLFTCIFFTVLGLKDGIRKLFKYKQKILFN
jgi:hypothetical protein